MFRKLFRRPQPESIEAPAPEVEIVPVHAAKPVAAEAERHPVLSMKLEPTTALGKVFPPQAASVFRHKPATTLRVPHLLQGYAGLAEHIQALSADIRPKHDTAEQWQQRLKQLQKIAKQIEHGEFNDLTNRARAASDADRDALLALDRLITLNKGSNEEQKTHRVQTFLTAAKEDHKTAQITRHDHTIESIHRSIASSRVSFQAGINKHLVQHIGTHTIKHLEPPAAVITASGIYATIDGILRSDKSDVAKWQSLRNLGQRVKDEDYPTYNGGHILPGALSNTLRTLLKKCAEAPLTSATRVELVQEAIEKFRPAAEYANWQGEMAEARAQRHAERQARILAGEELPAHDGVAALNRDYEVQMEALRKRPPQPQSEDSGRSYGYYGEQGYYRRPGPLSLERIDDTSKKFFYSVLGAGPLLVAGAYAMRPQIPAHSAHDSAAVEAPFDANAYSQQLQDKWQAEMDAADARWASASAIRSAAQGALPEEKPYRAHGAYRDIPALAPLPKDPATREWDEYHQCLTRNTDPTTTMLRPDTDCISPDMRDLHKEMDAKYGAAPQPAEMPTDTQTPPPISEAPAYTADHVRLMNEAFPKLAAGSGRKAEPLTPVNVNVTFDTNR